MPPTHRINYTFDAELFTPLQEGGSLKMSPLSQEYT